MAAMELSQQYLPNLLCRSHVNDDLCHNLISFNGVTGKIKEGLPGLGLKLSSEGHRRHANRYCHDGIYLYTLPAWCWEPRA